MMKLINAAYEILKKSEGQIDEVNDSNRDYGEVFNAALNAIIGLGLEIEICGAWIWVSGNTKAHKEILKAAYYLWSPKKMRWYFRPEGYKSRNRQSWEMEKIREVHGSQTIRKDFVSRSVIA